MSTFDLVSADRRILVGGIDPEVLVAETRRSEHLVIRHIGEGVVAGLLECEIVPNAEPDQTSSVPSPES